MSNQVLLTVSGRIPTDIRSQVAKGTRPRADYLELAKSLDADLLDYNAAHSIVGRTSALLERLGGNDLLLAYACWKLRKRYRAIVTDGEQVGLPLAALLRLTPGRRPRHLMIVHILSVSKKMFFLDRLGVQSCIDRFLVYSSWQKQFIEQRWNIRSHRVLLTPFMVDQYFFAANQVETTIGTRPQICAVGLERRDYTTLLQAVDGLDAQVVIAAASPWSKRDDTTTGQRIPDNVTVRRFTQYELRQLYADSCFLVMPLENVMFQAGVTAILEAMAMGKAVICSRIPGQTDVIVENENGLYIAPSDAAALRTSIEQLLAHPEEAIRLGTHGRHLIEREMSLDRYCERLSGFVHDTLVAECSPQGNEQLHSHRRGTESAEK